ncbi:MAG: hypothetical protein AB7R40_24195 [Nitrospiraceae bacterium]
MILDIRDEQEHADVATVLATLPEGHPARVAYAEGADTIKLAHLAPPELVERLTAAYLDGYRRYWQRSGSYFRP